MRFDRFCFYLFHDCLLLEFCEPGRFGFCRVKRLMLRAWGTRSQSTKAQGYWGAERVSRLKQIAEDFGNREMCDH